jgi:hypothetical protein
MEIIDFVLSMHMIFYDSATNVNANVIDESFIMGICQGNFVDDGL